MLSPCTRRAKSSLLRTKPGRRAGFPRIAPPPEWEGRPSPGPGPGCARRALRVREGDGALLPGVEFNAALLCQMAQMPEGRGRGFEIDPPGRFRAPTAHSHGSPDIRRQNRRRAVLFALLCPLCHLRKTISSSIAQDRQKRKNKFLKMSAYGPKSAVFLKISFAEVGTDGSGVVVFAQGPGGGQRQGEHGQADQAR